VDIIFYQKKSEKYKINFKSVYSDKCASELAVILSNMIALILVMSKKPGMRAVYLSREEKLKN